jgi:hypothetical protein
MLAHHAVDSLTALVVGHVSHRASINQANIGRLPLLSRRDPHLLEHLRKSRSLREIQLTPQSVIGCLFALKSRCIYHSKNGLYVSAHKGTVFFSKLGLFYKISLKKIFYTLFNNSQLIEYQQFAKKLQKDAKKKPKK